MSSATLGASSIPVGTTYMSPPCRSPGWLHGLLVWCSRLTRWLCRLLMRSSRLALWLCCLLVRSGWDWVFPWVAVEGALVVIPRPHPGWLADLPLMPHPLACCLPRSGMVWSGAGAALSEGVWLTIPSLPVSWVAARPAGMV